MTPPREETIFLDYLKARGRRVTAERRALLEAIFAQHRHIDADEVLGAVRSAGHKISRATVYRNLELLVACGLVHKVRLGTRRHVFEHLHPGQHHDHLTCRHCGRIIEFVSPGITATLGEICRAHGFAPRGNQLQIFGACLTCEPASAGLASRG